MIRDCEMCGLTYDDTMPTSGGASDSVPRSHSCRETLRAERDKLLLQVSELQKKLDAKTLEARLLNTAIDKSNEALIDAIKTTEELTATKRLNGEFSKAIGKWEEDYRKLMDNNIALAKEVERSNGLYREARNYTAALIAIARARRVMEPQHSREGHECDECNTLFEADGFLRGNRPCTCAEISPETCQLHGQHGNKCPAWCNNPSHSEKRVGPQQNAGRQCDCGGAYTCNFCSP